MSDQTPTTSRADGNKAARRTRRQLLVGGTGAMAAALTAEAFIRPTAAMAAAADELFTYNGTPAAGTLVASVAAENATDQFGNSYLSGETAYAPVGGGFIACQNNGGAVTFYTAASEAGPWAALPQLTAQAVASGSGILEFGAGVGPGIAVVGPTGDMTGGKDQKNIQQALGAFLSVVLLPGTFYLGKPVTMTSQNQVLSGCGLSTILQEPTSGSFSGSALIMPSASSQRVTNLQFSTKAASFIDFANAFMFYFECDHITGTAGASASDIFTGANLHRSHLHDLNLTQDNPAKSIWTMTGTTGVSVFTWDNSSLAVSVGTSGKRTAPAISIMVAGQEFVDAIRFENLFCDNIPNTTGVNIDNSQWFFDIACNGAGNIHDRIEFDHVTGNRCLGGLIRVQSSWGISLQNVSVGNMTEFDNNSTLVLKNNIIEIGTNATSGRSSAAVRIINYEREGNTNLVVPTQTVQGISDIDISSDTTQVYIESPNATGTSPQPQIDLNGAANVQIMSPSLATNILKKNSTSGQATIVIGNGQVMIG